MSEELNKLAVEKLLEYLRIRTDHPKPDYGKTKILKSFFLEGKRYKNWDIYGRGVQDMKSVGIQ